MLIPANERLLYALKSSIECFAYCILKFFRLWSKRNPFIMDIRNYLTILLHIFVIHVVGHRCWIAFAFNNFRLFLDVSDQVKVFNLACASWWQHKIIDRFLFYLVGFDFGSVIKVNTDVKKWGKTSWRLVSLRTRLVEVHLQNQVKTFCATLVKLFESLDHVGDGVGVNLCEGFHREKIDQIGESEELNALLTQLGSVTVGHTRRECELGKDIWGLFALHAGRILVLVWLLLASLVQVNFACDAVTKFLGYLADTIPYIGSWVFGNLFDFSLALLLLSELDLFVFIFA